MKQGLRIVPAALWLLLSDPLPAYADFVSPQGDGILSLLMLFPVTLFGLRLGHVEFTNRERKFRILGGVVLGFFALVALFEVLSGLVVVFCSLARGVAIMTRGQSRSRYAVGAAVVLFTLLAGGNYVLSAFVWRPSQIRSVEVRGAATLKSLVTAEAKFRSAAVRDVNKNGVGEYSTLEELQRAGFLATLPESYRVAVVLSGNPARDEREFFAYATPTNYGKPGLMPGTSLLQAIRPGLYARASLAVDETGVIRGTDLGSSRAVTREETLKWRTW